MPIEALPTMQELLLEATVEARRSLIDLGISPETADQLTLSKTPSLEKGDLAFPCFPYGKRLRRSPQQIANDVAKNIASPNFTASVDGGYVNLQFSPELLAQSTIQGILHSPTTFADSKEALGRTILIEYSSPNTNKPQHLGHGRNNVIGQAVAELAKRLGYSVCQVNLINDRGIHICKSMEGYRRYGEGGTPEQLGKKGDHFVGDMYVLFEKALSKEFEAYKKRGGALEKKDAFFNSPDSKLGVETRSMLQAWEDGDKEVRDLWKLMNSWVLKGFEETYARLGIEFDWVQRESQTYLLGKELVEEGHQRNFFFPREDGAIVCDLAQLGQKGVEGQKVLLRADGTSVYMTQDMGTAILRFDERKPDCMTYVVANEQNHHFQVLFGILNLLRPGIKDKCRHLSYGMVNLPSGRMKSREGNVVDLDCLLQELADLVSIELKKRDRTHELSDEERNRRAEVIGQAALRYYLLSHNPASTIMFDPEKSIGSSQEGEGGAFRGKTGPYLLYAYARSRQILKKAGCLDNCEVSDPEVFSALMGDGERGIIRELFALVQVLPEAAKASDPSRLCSQLYTIAQTFSTFYNAKDASGKPLYPVVVAKEPKRSARLALVGAFGAALKMGLSVLRIEVLEEM